MFVWFKEGSDPFPSDANGKVIYSKVDYVNTWEAMGKLVEKGLVKSIAAASATSILYNRLEFWTLQQLSQWPIRWGVENDFVVEC